MIELSPQATSLTPYAKRVAPLRPGRGRGRWPPPWSTRRPPRRRPRPRPAGRGPSAGRRGHGRGHRRSALPGRGRRPGGRGGPGPGRCAARRPLPSRPAPGQRQRRPRHGVGSRAPARPGDPRRRPRLVRPRLGFGTGGPGTRHRGHPPAAVPSRPMPVGCRCPWVRVRSLIVLGADPLSDFPDRGLAGRALDNVDFVVAVASSPGAITERADVILPAAEAHERPGTTTNIEGRISRLGQKLVPPGTGVAGLDDRRRAGRAPRRRPRPRLGGRGVGRDRAAGPGLPRDHPGRARRPGDGRRRGRPAHGQPGVDRPSGCAPRSDRLPRCRIRRAPGGPAPGRPGRAAERGARRGAERPRRQHRRSGPTGAGQLPAGPGRPPCRTG